MEEVLTLKASMRRDVIRGHTLCLPLAALVVATPAVAQQAAQAPEPAVTESKPAEKWIPKLRAGTDESYMEFYGQIDKGVLIFDDGGSTLGYAPVDNGNSTSRAGIRVYRRPQ